MVDQRTNFAPHLFRTCECAVLVGVGKQGDELLAAVTTYNIDLPASVGKCPITLEST